jgi:hypothetical protein
MVSRIHGTGRCWWWIGGILLTGALWAREGAAQPAAAGAARRLRPAGMKAAALLEAGIARSETFRLLVDAIERSDLVVYVETGVLAVPGQVQFVAATPRTRYIRVSVRVPGLENDLLAWLAHELCHATEIAAAPDVTGQASLRTYYDRVGGSLRAGPTVIMETSGAQKVQAAVERELRTSTRRKPASR